MIRVVLRIIVIGLVTTGQAAAADQALVFDAGSVGTPNSGAPIELWQPAGSGPFASMVVLHGCNGVGEGSRGWAARLAS